MAGNKTLIGGVTTTVQKEITLDDLVPNNYLTIIWRDAKTGETFNSLDIDNKQALEYTVALQNSIDQAISSGKISYAGQSKYINLESLAKYLAQNTIEAGPKRTVINDLIGLASGSQTALSDSTKNLIVNIFGSIADDVARSFGFTDPHEVFASFANENTIKLFTELGNKAQKYIEDCISKFSNKKKDKITSNTDKQKTKTYAGLIMGLTTSDTESMDITIPRKKVEDGSNYTTHLLPQPFKKEFNVILTNKVLTPDFNRTQEIKNIEFVKDKLIEIAKSRTTFDIYVRLSNDVMYKRSNVVFSSLSFTKDENSGNGYTASFTIEPINTFKVKTFISDRKYFPSSSGTTGKTGNGGTGNGGKGGSKRKESDTTSKGDKVKVGWDSQSDNVSRWKKDGIGLKNAYLTREQIMKHASNNGYVVLYDSKANPQYTFVRPGRVAKTKNGVIALKEHIITKTEHHPVAGNHSGHKIIQTKKLSKNFYAKGNKVSNGKFTYEIIVPPNSTIKGMIK